MLEQEALADADGPKSEGRIIVLSDLIKCFEKVRLVDARGWGVHWKMPRRVLRMVLATFSLARRVQLDGSLSAPAQTIIAIVAGSSYAVALLHAILVRPCDTLLGRWHMFGLAKYIDDLSISIQGVSCEITVPLLDAVEWLFRHLRENIGLAISLNDGHAQGKTVAIATYRYYASGSVSPLRRGGINLRARARSLGLEQKGCGAGGGASDRVRAERMAKVIQRKRNMLIAKRAEAAVTTVFRQGRKPAAMYGNRAIWDHTDGHTEAEGA